MTATRTGRTVNCYGKSLAEIDQPLGDHDTVEVDGVWYYTWDCGGFLVGSRTATGTDYGGNDLHGTRTAPQPTTGLATGLRGLPGKITYGEPEIIGAGHCD